MKILHIIATANPEDGGPIEGVLQLREQMALRGGQVELLTLDPPDAEWVRQFAGIIHAKGRTAPTGRGPWARLQKWARISPDAVAWARAHVHAYDVVVVNGLWNYATRVARLALAGSDRHYVVFAHGMLDPWFRKRNPLKHIAKQLLWLFNEGILLRRADKVLFTCEEERLLARRTFRPYRVREQVVAYGAAEPIPRASDEIPAFRAMVPGLGARRYLLFLGRIHEKKGCDLLIKGFAAVAQRDPELDLVIAGPDSTGLRPALERIAGRPGIAERIHWPGMVKGLAKAGALRGADAFVLPSHQENFGIAVAEALSYRCPVLISDRVNIWREIDQAGAGFCGPDTLEGTISVLNRWFDLDESSRETMRDRAQALYASNFTVSAAAGCLWGIFNDITKS